MLYIKKSFFLSIGCAILLSSGVFLFATPLTALFGVSTSIYEECRIALLITALSFPFIGITRLTSAVFMQQESQKTPLYWYT